MGFIFVIFALVLFFIMLIPSIILSIVSRIISIFRGGRTRRSTFNSEFRQWSNNSAHYESEKKNSTQPRKKLFDKDEGEYVDFEEIE